MGWKTQDNIKFAYYFKLIYRFNANPMKISAGFLFLDIDRFILKCIWEGRNPRVAKIIAQRTEWEE